MEIPADMCLQLLMVADYLNGAYYPDHGVDNHEYCLLIWPSIVWGTEISPVKALESTHSDLITVLVSPIRLWDGTFISMISAAKHKEISYRFVLVGVVVFFSQILRSEFSAGLDKIKKKSVEVVTSFMAYLSKLWQPRNHSTQILLAIFRPKDEIISLLNHGIQSFL